MHAGYSGYMCLYFINELLVLVKLLVIISISKAAGLPEE